MYSNGSPHIAEQKQDDQREHTYSSYVRIRDVALKSCLRRWTIWRSDERGAGISVLAIRHDCDDIRGSWFLSLYTYVCGSWYIYIYIYMYICVCVCVCVCGNWFLSLPLSLYIYIFSLSLCIYIYIYMWKLIYIYIEREREREKQSVKIYKNLKKKEKLAFYDNFFKFLYIFTLFIHPSTLNIPNKTPHRPDDGSAEPKRYSIDWLCFSINPYFLFGLLVVNFSSQIVGLLSIIFLHIYIYIYIYICVCVCVWKLISILKIVNFWITIC